MSGSFGETGIPAALVSKYLTEHGVVVEKTGLYSFFILFTIGITKGRWNTLLTALQQFKDDYDRNQPLWRILPDFCKVHRRYERMGLRDLCQQIHEAYRERDVARLTTEMYLSDMVPALAVRRLRPHGAPRGRARRHRQAGRPRHRRAADAVPAGHSAADPGRALQPHHRAVPAVRARVQRALPGFETYIHGLADEVGEDGEKRYYVDCLKEE